MYVFTNGYRLSASVDIILYKLKLRAKSIKEWKDGERRKKKEEKEHRLIYTRKYHDPPFVFQSLLRTLYAYFPPKNTRIIRKLEGKFEELNTLSRYRESCVNS